MGVNSTNDARDEEGSAFDFPGWRQLEAELHALDCVTERVTEKLSAFKTFKPITEALDDELQQFITDMSVGMDECEDDIDEVLQFLAEVSQDQSYLFEALEAFEFACDEVLDDLENTFPTEVFDDLSNLLKTNSNEIVGACHHFANVLAGAVVLGHYPQKHEFKRMFPQQGRHASEVLLDVCQKVGNLNQRDSMEVVFHMTDWRHDLDSLSQFLANPQGFSYHKIHQILVNFLVHAPNHIAAAAKLYVDYPVRDIFGVGALDENHS